MCCLPTPPADAAAPPTAAVRARRTLRLAAVVSCLLLVPTRGAAQDAGATIQESSPRASIPARPNPQLAAILQPLIDAHPGTVGVAIKHLGTGDSFMHRPDEPMPTASLIKLPMMVTAYQQIADGKLTREEMLELRAEDKVPGSGILTNQFSPGLRLSFRDTIRLMIAYSDNTATNLVADVIGLEATTAAMRQLGFPNTRLHSKVYRRDTSIDPARSQRFGLGSTTAGETAALLELIDRGEIVNREVCDEMLEHLYACDDREKLARFLPPKVRIAHKSGYVSKARCDAGLIEGPNGRIAIAVLTENNADTSFSGADEPSILIGNLARESHRFFYPAAWAEQPVANSGVLGIGSVGLQVEALQRTLNRLLEPSPQLGVDGDFGPATEAALLQFQRSVELPATGQLDEATAKQLGPLTNETPDSPAAESADPASPAAEEPDPAAAKTPEEPSGAPPAVSCRAWAIGDATTGEILFGFDDTVPLDNASTTKLMTAWLVGRFLRTHPAAIDELITFSKRADETIGSTAGVRVGEQVRVGDLLYGLLLPSGNDASVALAEHFGSRLVTAQNASDAAPEPHDAFVACMNEAAKEIGLDQTSFRNPHGLTAPGHAASARDLVRLGQQVLADPLLSQVVSTGRYRCEVTAAEGGQREVVWTNTNRLLGVEAYDGLKTGTTTAAGACLVASGSRNDRRLIVVVLGSSGSAARYADARNLFRWAWQNLEQPAKELQQPAK